MPGLRTLNLIHASERRWPNGPAVAQCHPERKHQAKGLCARCYTARYQRAHRTDPQFVETMRRGRRAFIKRNPDKPRRDWLKVAYGITREQYDVMWQAQGGLCAICQLPSIGGKSLAVDHDHATGAIRGLLCMNCNRMLGQAGDDPKRLMRAVAYLRDR